VGLGNPGRKYERTRHNAGFLVADALVARWGLAPERLAADADSFGGVVGRERVAVVKPATYMNLSGQALGFLRYSNADPTRDLLVLSDDFALPLGGFKLLPSGSAGGHNGLRSVEAALGTDAYPRLRVGVGPLPAGVRDWSQFVLGSWTPEEFAALQALMPTLLDAVECWSTDGIETAMTRFNRLGRKSKE